MIAVLAAAGCTDLGEAPPAAPPPPPTPSRVSVELSPVADATLYEATSGSLADGAGPGLFAGKTSGLLQLRRALLRFDVAGALSPGAAVDSVFLSLECTRAPDRVSRTMMLHRLDASWAEGPTVGQGPGGGFGGVAVAGDATWDHREFDTTLWSVPGGDFVSAPSAPASVESVGIYEWGSTPRLVADVQAWLDDPSIDHGWVLRGDEVAPKTGRRFASRESATAPRLRVVYTPPASRQGGRRGTRSSSS